jgi:hypothetical protein
VLNVILQHNAESVIENKLLRYGSAIAPLQTTIEDSDTYIICSELVDALNKTSLRYALEGINKIATEARKCKSDIANKESSKKSEESVKIA